MPETKQRGLAELRFHAVQLSAVEEVSPQIVLAKVRGRDGVRWVWSAPGRGETDPRVLLFEVEAMQRSIETALVDEWEREDDR